VTLATWDSARDDGIVTGELADATDDALRAIYRTRYWNAAHCSSLPSGVDLMVFQQGTLSGIGHVVRLLQRVVGATVDGAVGPETLRLTAAMDVRTLIDAIVRADIEYLAALGNAPLFLHGWTRREVAAQALAYQLARIKPAPPP
jgi:lysozyme family protein